jgi:hypothetical protein
MQARYILASSIQEPSAVVQAVPMLASAAALEEVLEELQRLFGASADPLSLLCRNPSLAETCQGLSHQARGDRDADYLKELQVGM